MQSNPGKRIRGGEWRAVTWSFVAFFCILAAYYMIRPVREQLASAVGSTQLPWFYGSTFLAMLALAPVFGVLVSRFPRRVAVPVIFLFFIACLLGFVPLFLDPDILGARALGIVFFVWVSVFNLFVVSVFWSFMVDIWSEEQTRRLFPVIAVAGTVGAVVGPVLTRTLVGVVGIAPLLVISATLLAAALTCLGVLGRWSRSHGINHAEAREGTAIGGGMFDGIRQIFASPFVRSMALLLLLADGIGTVNYALVTDYSRATFGNDAVARTAFAANVDMASNLLTVLVQVFLTRWLLPRKGPGLLIALWALVSIGALSLVIFASDPYAPLVLGFPAVAVALIISRGLAFGMAEPARHSLFARVPRTERYKGQNAVDTAVWRFGDMAIATSMNVLRSFGMATAGFASLSALAALLAAGIGLRLTRQTEHGGADGARRNRSDDG